MSKFNKNGFGTSLEAILYPLLLLLLLWSIFLVERFYPHESIQLGILPKTVEGIKGIFLSPLLHSPSDINHILNNSLPAAVLFGALVFFYRSIAAQVFFISWIFSGFFVWAFADNNHAYHIGFSSVIYALVGFLFTSGTLRKYRPLQGISLFVVFIYGSMIWGILPLENGISWEGHFSGLFVGVILAFLYRKKGPQSPKYQFEIEKELGIEPPDLEGIWKENMRLTEEENTIREEALKNVTPSDINVIMGESPKIMYEYKKKDKEEE